MNLLTKFLIGELLDEQKTVAIYGGGFKPPTKGHFTVAKKVLEDFPEIDELKIFVGGGVRDGITQDESIKIWNIYKKYLSPKVDVEASVAPVKSVLGYAKENPDTKVYWILGARDGDEGDLADIKNRTKSLDKYPNLEVKVITTSGGVSGTKTRQAVRDNNKEQFFHMIPDVNDTEKEEIWNMVSLIIKEGFTENLKSKFNKFLSAVKQENQETKEVVGLLVHAAKGEIKLTDEQKEYIGNQLKDVLKLVGLTAIATLPGGFIAGVLIKLFKAEHLVTPSSMMNEVGEANLKPYKWQELDMNGYVAFARFVTDSETQYDIELTTTSYHPEDSNLSIKALLIEFIAKPKGAEGSSAYIVVNKGEMYRVMATIVDIVKKYTKKLKAKAILYSPSKKQGEDFGTQRDQLYKAFISKAIPGVKFEQKRDLVAAILPDAQINEVGEANLAPYKWEEVDIEGYSIYTRFITDSETQYDVDLTTTSYVDDDLNNYKALEIEFTAKLKGDEGSSAKIVVNKGELYKVMSTIADIVKFYVKKYKIQAISYSPSKKSDEENFGSQRDNLYKAFISKALPGVKFEKNSNFITAILPDTINELVTDTEVICDNCGWEWSIKDGGKDLYICHKCGHDNNPDLGEASDPQAGTALPYSSGFAPVKEAKQEVKDSMVVVLSRKDNQINLYDLKTNEALGVINTYGNEVTGVAAKKGYGPLMYELGMANVYPNGLQSDRHGNTEPAAENIWKKYIAGTSPNIKVQNLTPKDKDYRTTYAGDGYDSSYLPDFYNYKFYNPDTATLKQLIQKGNTLSDELKKQIVLDSDKLYSNMVRESNSKDPFGLNELARQFLKETLKETWRPEESFVSLSRYMIDNGMNIKPLPKIKVIKDDKENASNLLGKTAYYNPVEKSITLFTMNRHPKDILRSFAHEMIHHEQNLKGKLNNITTQNTNEDGDLPEIEKEAYEKGNMMLRNWEDKIKNV
jgi:hypothetical protein